MEKRVDRKERPSGRKKPSFAIHYHFKMDEYLQNLKFKYIRRGGGVEKYKKIIRVFQTLGVNINFIGVTITSIDHSFRTGSSECAR